MGKAQEEGTKGNIHGLEWEPQVRQICPLPDWWWVLALICIGQPGGWGRGDKKNKGGSQDGLRPLLQGWPNSHPNPGIGGVPFLFTKLNSELQPSPSLSFEIFVAARLNWENHTFPTYWSVSGEVSRSQHHQPSGSNQSGAYMLWATCYHYLSPTWRGFQYLQNSLKIWLRVSLDQEPGPGLKPALLLPLTARFFPGIASSAFTNWQLLETARWNSEKVMEAERRLFPIIWEMGDTERIWVQKSYSVLLSIS